MIWEQREESTEPIAETREKREEKNVRREKDGEHNEKITYIKS